MQTTSNMTATVCGEKTPELVNSLSRKATLMSYSICVITVFTGQRLSTMNHKPQQLSL